MKYGIMYYKETDNIGDDIQTYTALRFLPHIDYYINRENLNCFIPSKEELVSVIMNGWFLHNKLAWPPSPYINPLLTSMHFTCLDSIDVGEKYLQGIGGEYLKSYEPIGARDTETEKRLNKNGIKSYFSGCMTLTINPFKNIEKKDYICIVDLDDNSSKLVKENTKREIKEITHDLNPNEISKISFKERMENVEELLKTYQSAHVVLTNRLHVALPCIALGTPVILVHKENFEKDRLGTFLKFVNSYTDKQFANTDVSDLIENPKQNNEEYREIRENLIKRCEEFIEKCENMEENNVELPSIIEYKKYVKKISWYKELGEEIRVKAKNNVYKYEKKYSFLEDEITKLKNLNEENLEELRKNQQLIIDIQNELKEKQNTIDEIYNSRGWKFLTKIRKIKKIKGDKNV